MIGTIHDTAGKQADWRLLLLLLAMLAQQSAGQDFWTSMGPFPGTASKFVINPINGFIYSIDAGVGGVTLSSDGGMNWSHADWGASNNSVAVNSKGEIFLGSGVSFWRSTTSGTSWEKLVFPKPPILSLLVTLNGTILAGTGANALFRSTDNGTSWTQVDAEANDNGVLAILSSRIGTLFCVTRYKGLRRSTDDGRSWQATDLSSWDIGAITFDPGGDGWVGSMEGKLFRSTDDGMHWIEVPTGLAPLPIRALLVSNRTGILLGREGEELLRSLDQGRSWSPAQGAGARTSFRSMCTVRGDTLVAGTAGGLARSTDAGGSWHVVGIAAGTIMDISAQPDGTLFMAFSGDRCKVSHDHCETFLDLGPTDFARRAVCLGFNRKGYLFVGMEEGFYRSTNRGESWKRIGDEMPSTRIRTIAFDGRGNMYAGTESGLSRSTNDGDDWSPWVLAAYTLSLAIPSDSVIIAGAGGGIYRSTDGAKSWSLVKTAPPPGKDVYAILAFDPVTLYAAWGDVGMLVSTDAGVSWTTPPTMANCAPIRCLRRDANGTMYAATDYGIFISHDRWKSWTNPRSGMRNFSTKTVAVDRDGFIYAGTGGGGIYRSASPITSAGSPPQPPAGAGNEIAMYPNPLAHFTTIRYSVAAAGHVRLDVFDPFGRIVATLVDEEMGIGTHASPFTPHALPSGVYYCRLATKACIVTRKVIILK